METSGSYDAPSFVIAPHIGLLVPQAFSNLGLSPVFGLEVGYILPFDVGSMERPFQIHLDAAYSMAGASGDGVSDALGENGSGYDWDLTEQVVTLDLGFLWRFMRPGDGLSAFGEFAPRMYFTNSVLNASGNGDDFGENSETNMFFGFAVAGGAEYFVGIGSIYGALEFGWSDLSKTITGDTNNGALLIDFGYRFMF